MDVASTAAVFRVFVVFFQKEGVVQPVEQKLRQPFLPKLKKPIVFAIKLA